MSRGRAGDFDFLAGEWRIHNRRIQSAESQEWDEFGGEATCWTILNGLGSIEELRIPERGFFGMGLRLLDVDQQLWTDHWVNANRGVLTLPGQTGFFEAGVGTFVGDYGEGPSAMRVKGVWDQITPRSCRWSQAVSRDQGRSWQENWVMVWDKIR